MCVPLNTAFVDRSIMRLVGRQVESSSDYRLPEDFFIDITFAEVSDSLMQRHPSIDGHDALLSLDEARHGWKSVLAQTSGMTVQDFYA